MEPVYASVTTLAAAIRAGDLSATEVLDAHLAQIARHNPTLNAIITLDADGARARAREADAALARGECWGPLHGVPFTLKDAFATAGMRTTIGFPPLADFVPQEDSTVAARLKAAGGGLLGKTNVPTLLGDYQCDNPLFGRTVNPWDTARTSGGSSGGAAAALAAGLTPFEIGSDLSGSIRLPAHFCGVYGLKPTEGRVPLTGMVPDPRGTPRSVRLMSCAGPLARTVEDLALLYGLIAGPDGRDAEVPPVPLDAIPALDLTGLRIAVAPTFPGLPVAAEVRDAVTGLARQLADAGAIVEEAALPDRDFGQDLLDAGGLIGMMVGVFEQDAGAPPLTLAHYLAALHSRDDAIRAWEQFFARWDALLCPTSPVTAFPHCEPGAPLRVDDRDESYWLASAHATLFNYTGHPALAIPHTRDRDGLPLGVQLVAKRWAEARLLGVAQAIAPLTGGFQRPAGY
ncbi:MAG TPA: amidase [Thermomicrobiales bacterium]|jgi:amidase